MSASNPGIADLDLEHAIKASSFLQDIRSEDGTVPQWVLDVRAHRLAQQVASKIPRKPRLQIRAIDCDSWIKKDNRYTGGIRKRQLSRKPEGMPQPVSVAQYQRHAIHQISKVLSLRTNASPFTLVLDDLNQRAMPLLGEFTTRGLSRKVNVVVVAFENTRFHLAVRHIPAYGDHTGAQILAEIERAMGDFKESLVIVDSLHDLLNVKSVDMSALFNLVVMKFASSLVGVYHQDMVANPYPDNAYVPQSLDVLKFMATTIITTKSFAHVLAAKAAKERSLPEPTHGLLQGAEGIVQCLNANDLRGIVFEAEFRRKSGRPETESYFLRPAMIRDYNPPLLGMPFGTLKREFIVLLDQVPAYASKEVIGLVNAKSSEIESTFNLDLTDKQKAAREGVVLPYFDAQKGEGGEGGRILYDMGSEDDFDEEEDEI